MIFPLYSCLSTEERSVKNPLNDPREEEEGNVPTVNLHSPQPWTRKVCLMFPVFEGEARLVAYCLGNTRSVCDSGGCPLGR